MSQARQCFVAESRLEKKDGWFHRSVCDGVPQPRQPRLLRHRVRHRLDAEPDNHDRVPWCGGSELSEGVRGEAPALPHLAVQGLELPDRQQAGSEAGPGMSDRYGSTQLTPG